MAGNCWRTRPLRPEEAGNGEGRHTGLCALLEPEVQQGWHEAPETTKKMIRSRRTLNSINQTIKIQQKSLKLLSQLIMKHYFKILGTGAVNSPLSPPFLKTNTYQ